MRRRCGGIAAELLQIAAAQWWVVEQTATMRRGALLRTTKHRLAHNAPKQVLILEHRSSGDLHGRQTYVCPGQEMYWLDNAASVRTVIHTRSVPEDARPVVRAL